MKSKVKKTGMIIIIGDKEEFKTKIAASEKRELF
jgi:hypothetical protein